jgi:hypothetical protein
VRQATPVVVSGGDNTTRARRLPDEMPAGALVHHSA